MRNKSANAKNKKKSPNQPIHKGWWFRVLTRQGSHDIVGLSTKAEAMYQIERYYIKAMYVDGIQLFVGEKPVSLFEGENKMSKFTQFREDAAKDNKGGLDSVPFMVGEDRTLFIRTGVPFSVTGGEEVTTKFGQSIAYDIHVNTASPEYQKAGKMLDIQPEYKLFVRATSGRRSQKEHLMNDAIKNQDQLILVKPAEGGAWDFDLYE